MLDCAGRRCLCVTFVFIAVVIYAAGDNASEKEMDIAENPSSVASCREVVVLQFHATVMTSYLLQQRRGKRG